MSKLYESILAFVAIFMLAGLILGDFLWIKIGLIIIFIGMIYPYAFEGVSNAFYKIIEKIGTINSTIILSLIFYLMLTPLAVLKRFVSSDFLWIGKPTGDTYWRERQEDLRQEDLVNPF